MSNPDRLGIEASLLDLSDEDAVAVMEGRLPASDPPAVDRAAAMLAAAVLAEPEEVEAHGGNVIQLVRRQPWMRMAAAVVLGVSLTLALTTEEGPTSGAVATSNVLYLEPVRGPGEGLLPEIRIPGKSDWVTLIAFPSVEADAYRIRLEHAADESAPGGVRRPVFEDEIGAGTQDSLVINIPASMLVSGEYTLDVDSVHQGTTVDSATLRFQVKR